MRSRAFLALGVALLPWLVSAQPLAGWSNVETNNFRFRFPPDTRVDPKVFAIRQEQAYTELKATFGAALPGKIDFYVWNSTDEAERLLGRPLGFARPDLLLVHTAYTQTRGHELTHVLMFHTVRPERASRFLEEGTAVAFDLSGRDRMATARATVRAVGGPQSIAEVWQQSDRLPERLLYPVAGAFVERLIARGGQDRFLQLLKDQTIERARAIYGADFDPIVRAFESDVFGDQAGSKATGSAAQAAGEPTLAMLRATAQERMQRDLNTYSRQELQEIETLYQSANRDLRAPAAKDALVQLLKKYPKANRTGCSILYLAQLSTGIEKEQYLKTAIADHADAWYGDGAQVGALARAQLASVYGAAGRLAEAQKLAEEVGTLFPGAVDHTGAPLVDTLRRMKLLQ